MGVHKIQPPRERWMGPALGVPTRKVDGASSGRPGTHLRVVCLDGLPTGCATLDGLHGCGVQGLLCHRPLLICRAPGPFGLALPLLLVDVVHTQQEAIVHDLEAL